MDWRDEVRPIVKKQALLNAAKFGGRAEVKAVLSRVLYERADLKPAVREVAQLVAEVVAEVNALPRHEQLRLIEELGLSLEERAEPPAALGLPPLPDVEGLSMVITRFSPNPDSVLHIGNARAAILSHDYARMYRGRFYLRFEDTDPKLHRPLLEFYDAIREDLRWLGCEWDGEVIQSDRLPIYYEHAEQLIRLGGAYVCGCKPEVFRQLVTKGSACPHRELPADEQLREWSRMLEGRHGEGSRVVRIKTDLQHPNPAVRDWPALRIIDTNKHPHPRVGSQYRVWPLYNFAAGIDDHLMGITHIVRGKEHLTNTIRQQYMYGYLGWRYPSTLHYGRLKIVGVMLSKSKMMEAMAKGIFKDFSDPRLATLKALRRRGIPPEAIRKMVWEMGPRPVDATVSWENLYAVSRKIVDQIAPRYFFVKDPIALLVHGVEEGIVAKLHLHPNRPELGIREIKVPTKDRTAHLFLSRSDLPLLKIGGVVRLMELFNIQVTRIDSHVEANFHSKTYEEARALKAPLIHWLPADGIVPAKVVMPSAEEVTGYVERALLDQKVGSVIQMVRFAFGRIDELSEAGAVIYYSHP